MGQARNPSTFPRAANLSALYRNVVDLTDFVNEMAEAESIEAVLKLQKDVVFQIFATELSWKQIRSLLKHEWCVEKDYIEEYRKINGAWGGDTVAGRMAKKWFAKFKSEENSLDDQLRTGRAQRAPLIFCPPFANIFPYEPFVHEYKANLFPRQLNFKVNIGIEAVYQNVTRKYTFER